MSVHVGLPLFAEKGGPCGLAGSTCAGWLLVAVPVWSRWGWRWRQLWLLAAPAVASPSGVMDRWRLCSLSSSMGSLVLPRMSCCICLNCCSICCLVASAASVMLLDVVAVWCVMDCAILVSMLVRAWANCVIESAAAACVAISFWMSAPCRCCAAAMLWMSVVCCVSVVCWRWMSVLGCWR